MTIVEVSITANDVVLNSDDDTRLRIESRLKIAAPDGATAEFENVRDAAGTFTGLLGHAITEATGVPDGTLTLVFEDGTVCTVFDDSDSYESYEIKHGDVCITV
ncbi:DUF6188 family protein [Microbacteriaceae bacterium 4G12]